MHGGSTRNLEDLPELQSLRRLRSKSFSSSQSTGKVQDALAPYWQAWQDQPQKATVVLRRLAEEKLALALVVLECMGQSQVETNILHWNPVIFEMSKTDEWRRSLELLLLAMRSEILPDIQSFSSICNAASRAEAWQLAIDALREMSRMQLQVDERIHNIVASSCKSQWVLALSLLEDMQTSYLCPDAITLSTVCSTLSGAQWSMALNLLEASGRHFVEVDVTNYGATIDGLGETNWLRVMALLLDMSHRSVKLNPPAFNAAAGSFHWSRTLALMELKVPPNQLSFSALFSAIARVQRWKASLHLMRSLVWIRWDVSCGGAILARHAEDHKLTQHPFFRMQYINL